MIKKILVIVIMSALVLSLMSCGTDISEMFGSFLEDIIPTPSIDPQHSQSVPTTPQIPQQSTPRPETTPLPETSSSTPEIPSARGELLIKSEGNYYTAKAYMIYSHEYYAGSWVDADGLGFTYGYEYDPNGIPEIVFAPGMEIELSSNSTVNGISIMNGEPNDPSAIGESIKSLDELANYPNDTWYVIFSVAHNGYYGDKPVGTEYAWSIYEYVVKVTVPPTSDTTVMPERFINASAVEYISITDQNGSVAPQYRCHTTYFTEYEKILGVVSALKQLEFTSNSPLEPGSILIAPGSGNDVIIIKFKDGTSTNLTALGGQWLYGISGIYELTDESASALLRALYSPVPDKIDILNDDLAAIEIFSDVRPYAKSHSGYDAVRNFADVTNNLKIVDRLYESDLPTQRFVWSIINPFAPEFRIDFINFEYVYINNEWYRISYESGRELEAAVNNFVSEYAVPHYSHFEAMTLLERGMTKKEVEALFGQSVISDHYEFNDGKYIELIYDSYGYLNEAYVYVEMFGSGERFLGGKS